MQKDLYNSQKVIIFVLSLKQNDMRKTKEIEKKEKELLYLLALYRELSKRENASQIVGWLEIEIDAIVEALKK